MTDFSKRVDKADKLLEKGKKEAALSEYTAILADFPQNDALVGKASDLALSLGDRERAAELLLKAFTRCLDERDLLNTQAYYRKLARLRSPEPDLLEKYAALLQNTNKREASEVLRQASQYYQLTGRLRTGMTAIEQAIALSPRLELYQLQADLATELHEPGTAAAALVNVGVCLEKQGQDPTEAYEHAHRSDANNMGASLGYGRCLLRLGRTEEAVELLRPLVSYPSGPVEALEPYVRALLSLHRVLEAEPVVWRLFEADPKAHSETMFLVVEGLLQIGESEKALALLRRLEEHHRRTGKRGLFLERTAQAARNSQMDAPLLEYLGSLYNGANMEAEYSKTLSQLFELYVAGDNPQKAFDALERAAEIDPYNPGNRERLMRLEGKVDAARLAALGEKLGVYVPEHAPETAPTEEAAGGAKLDDLLVEAELFLQYAMPERAQEKLHQIQQWFPAEVSSNKRLRDLMRNAGLGAELEQPAGDPKRQEITQAFDRAADLGRLIAKQSEPRSLLTVVANELGASWGLSRCLGILGSPGQAPAAVVEYCAAGMQRSHRTALARIISAVYKSTEPRQILVVQDAFASAELDGLHAELEALAVRSLMGASLMDGDSPAGLLILQQCNRKRTWTVDESAILRTLADQMSLALQGIRLRSLVRTLGVTDEHSGLLNRSSYLDILLAEIHRSRSSGAALTVLLIELAGAQAGADALVTGVSNVIQNLLRATAVCFRYGANTIALVLPGTNARNAATLLAEIREAVAKSPDPTYRPLRLKCTIAEALREKDYQEEDIVTELINRADRGLEAARKVASGTYLAVPEKR